MLVEYLLLVLHGHLVTEVNLLSLQMELQSSLVFSAELFIVQLHTALPVLANHDVGSSFQVSPDVLPGRIRSFQMVNNRFLLFGPRLLQLYRRIQVVVESLAALRAGPPGQGVRHLHPAAHADSIHLHKHPEVLFFSPADLLGSAWLLDFELRVSRLPFSFYGRGILGARIRQRLHHHVSL